MRGRWIAELTVLALALAAPAAAQPVAAQPAPEPPAAGAPAKDPKVARQWLLAGQQLVQTGNAAARAGRAGDAKASYEHAVAAFERSIEAGDDLAAYALLAEAEDKLGRFDRALVHYRVVVKAPAGLRPDVVKKATAKADELAMKVGLVTLKVTPDGAAITLAGKELGKAPLAEPLVLLPGTYTVSFQAEGYQPREAALNVEAGSEAERTIELEAMTIVVQAPVTEPPPPSRAAPSRLPLYAGGGAAVALLGAAAVTGLLALGRHGTYTSRDATPAERDDARSSGQTLALVTDLALVGGLAAGGFTASWYLFKYRRSQEKPAERRPAAARAVRGRPDATQSTKIDMIPWVQPGASGLTLVGAF